jgi:hypothetical protein
MCLRANIHTKVFEQLNNANKPRGGWERKNRESLEKLTKHLANEIEQRKSGGIRRSGAANRREATEVTGTR